VDPTLSEGDDLAFGGRLALGAHGGQVRIIGIAVITSTPVKGKMLEGKFPQYLFGASQMIRMVVTDDLVVDFRNPKRLEVRHRLVALPQQAVVEQDRFPVRRDQNPPSPWPTSMK